MLCWRCRLNYVSNCVAVDHNCVEILCRMRNNDTVWCRCAWANVFSNWIADWSCDCKRDICAAILPNAAFCGRPMFVIGKSLCRIRCTWMVFPLNECIWREREKEKIKEIFISWEFMELEKGWNSDTTNCRSQESKCWKKLLIISSIHEK